jgi:hypothetical protein
MPDPNVPWQLLVGNMATSTVTPDAIQRREPFPREDDRALLSENTNTVFRIRDYTSDGHLYKQEAVLAVGKGAGVYMTGNDYAPDASYLLTYADLIQMTASTLNIKVPVGQLLWNSSPFNSALDPNSTLPTPIALAQQAFEVGEALAFSGNIQDAIDAIQNIKSLITNIGSGLASGNPLTALGFGMPMDGAADFTSPFAAWCTVTPQKVGMWNMAAILFLQLLYNDIPVLIAGAGPAALPVTINPIFLPIAKAAAIQWKTPYNASVQGILIGKELKSLMLSAVPGIGAAFS